MIVYTIPKQMDTSNKVLFAKKTKRKRKQKKGWMHSKDGSLPSHNLAQWVIDRGSHFQTA